MGFLKKSSCFIAGLSAGLALSLPCFADGYAAQSEVFPWSITASLGYAQYENMYKNDGQTAIGRLAFGWDFFLFDQGSLGAEVGIQNGNSMRLDVPEATLAPIGGVPIQSTFKPTLDLLLVLKTATWGETPLYGMLKAGGAYRRWQFENGNCVNDLSKLAGEVQVGLGYGIASRASLSLSYQGIFGGNPDFTVHPVTLVPHVSNIPSQHAILLGLTFLV